MTAFSPARLRHTVAAACACAGIGLSSGAAANVLFSGAGTWAADAAVNSLSAPGATWSFLFVLPDTLPASTTSAVSSFSYRLDGVAVSVPSVAMTFYGALDGGMFDLSFGGSLPSLSLYGDAVYADGAFARGNYDVFIGIGSGQPTGDGSLSLVQVVPEPSTWAMFALGLAGVAASTRAAARRFDRPVCV